MCKYVRVPIEDLIQCRELLKKHDVYLASKLWLLEQVCNREGWKGLKEGEIEVTGPKLAKAIGCDRRYANRILDKFIVEFDMLRDVKTDTLVPSSEGRMAKLVGSKNVPPSRPQEKPQEKPQQFAHNKGEVDIQAPSQTPTKTPNQAPENRVLANSGAGLEAPQEYNNINNSTYRTENKNEKLLTIKKDGDGLFDGYPAAGGDKERESVQEKALRTDPPVRTRKSGSGELTPRQMLGSLSKEHQDLLFSLVEAWVKKGGKSKAINFRTIVKKWVQICKEEPDINVLFKKMKPMVDEMKKRDAEYIQELSKFLDERSWEMHDHSGDVL